MRAFEIAASQPWLIRAEMLEVILEICARENVITAEVVDRIDVRKEALATQRGRRMDETRYTTRRGNVAVIDVSGPIVRYADFFTEISGGASTEHLATDFRMAVEDPTIAAIILSIDSPGGQATGINELANQIFEARGKKPIASYVGGDAASAAYWIASAADEIVIDATAMLGSIGTVISVPAPDPTAKRRIEVVSTQSPKKRPDVTTDAGRSELLRIADELANVFIDAVAKNRGVTAETVVADFGQGSMRIGGDAVDHKMADRMGSLESLIKDLNSRPRTAATKTKETKAMFTKEFKESLGLSADATDEQVNAKITEMKQLASRTATAEKDSKTVRANASVDELVKAGKLSGNSVVAFRTAYVKAACGETVTVADFDAIAAALPQLKQERISKDAKTDLGATVVSLADFSRAASDVEASRRISQAVAERKKADPKFTAAALERELRAADRT